jgi:hypothetical protein
MATYDDFDGVWFTIQAIGMYQRDVLPDVSFLVIDNHPGGPAGPPLRALEEWLPRYRYVPFDGYRGTAVRDLVFREADADIVCCLDSHVLLRPGALASLLDWFGAHPGSRDLLQGPLLYDNLEVGATHLEPTWGAGMFGQWGRDPRIDAPGAQPFEIPMQGLGLFACRREAWPGLNPRLRGFGGEEGYLHEKFRQRGGRVLCHPGLGWLHRFSRPSGVAYPNIWEDRVRNYYIGWSEVGWDLEPARSHFRELLGAEADALLDRAGEQAGHPLNAFDGVFCLAGACACACVSGACACTAGTCACVSGACASGACVSGACAAGACAAGDAHAHPPEVAWRVEHGPAPALAGGSEQRRLAGWHAAVTAAARRGYRHLLLLDGPVPAGPLPGLSVPPPGQEWDLVRAGRAVAVHERAYKRLQAELPADEEARAAFIAAWGGLDGYLARMIADGIFTGIDADPGAARPRRAADADVTELDQGLLVRSAGPGTAHQLNNTAAVIWDLCDGHRTVPQIASDLASAFGLDRHPLAEVTAAITGFRYAGILAEPAVNRTAESRNP